MVEEREHALYMTIVATAGQHRPPSRPLTQFGLDFTRTKATADPATPRTVYQAAERRGGSSCETRKAINAQSKNRQPRRNARPGLPSSLNAAVEDRACRHHNVRVADSVHLASLCTGRRCRLGRSRAIESRSPTVAPGLGAPVSGTWNELGSSLMKKRPKDE
ncbi:hypothetical protein MTO96_007382 [Rhipicephalus appendiculatus]